MQRLLQRPGYRLYAADSPEAGALPAEQGLSPADLDRALARLERTEGTTVRTIVGINEDGVFGSSRAARRPGLPDTYHEPFIPLLWLKVHELLGRVPEGSTAQFIHDGTLPGEGGHSANIYRIATEGLDPKHHSPSVHYAAAATRPAAVSVRWRGNTTTPCSPLVNMQCSQ